MGQVMSGQAVQPTPVPGKLKLYLLETRAPFFTATLVPIVLGGVIAWSTAGVFNWWYFILSLIGGICLHAGTNIANDYWDHKSSNDEVNVEYVRPFTGGSRMIQLGLLTPNEVLWEAIFFFLVATIIGIYLTWALGLTVLVLGIIAVISGFFYCAPPLRLSYHGLGEIAIGLNFGPLMVFGAYWVQTQTFSWLPFVAAVPTGILIAAVVYINEFQDAAADRAVGRKHLIVRWGKEKGAKGYGVLMAVVYGWIVLGVLAGLLSIWLPWLKPVSLPFFALLGLVTWPKALQAFRIAREFHSDSQKLTPANALTIMNHLHTGIWVTLGFVLWWLWQRLYPVISS